MNQPVDLILVRWAESGRIGISGARAAGDGSRVNPKE